MAALTQGLVKQVTCAICLEQYKDPRVLPCLHSYCRHCLENLVAKSRVKKMVACPECRTDVQITPSAVSGLKVNFWVNNLLSLLAICSAEDKEGRRPMQCENCDSQETTMGRCTDCCVFMCHFCITAHQRVLSTKHHSIMTLDQVKRAGPRAMEKLPLCVKHKGEVLKLFCKTCQELICRDCTIVDHRDHKYLFTSDVIGNEKETILAAKKKAEDKVPNIKAALSSVTEMKRKVEVKSDAVSQEVDLVYDKQIKVLQQTRATLKDKVEEIRKDRLKQLTAQEDELILRLTTVKSSVDFTESALKNGSDNDVLSINKELVSRLSDLASKPVNEKPCQGDALQLEVNHEVWDALGNAGRITEFGEPDLYLVTINGELAGNEVTNVILGNQCSFQVTVTDQYGKPCRRSKSDVQVLITVPKTVDVVSYFVIGHKELKYKKDGTYVYTPSVAGRHICDVTVGGKSIKGSPFTLEVVTRPSRNGGIPPNSYKTKWPYQY